MTLSNRTVCIPLVSKAGHEGQIAYVLAEKRSSPKSNDAKINPQIMELVNCQLYSAGTIALGAFKRLQFSASWKALWQRLTGRTIQTTLFVTFSSDNKGLSSGNDKSAELGLALAFVMHAGQSRDTKIVATGSLARSGSSMKPGAEESIKILPVAGLSDKIATITASLDQDNYNAHLRFFLPAQTLTGKPVEVAHRQELAQLKAACEQRRIKLEICPVSSLRQTADNLGVNTLATTMGDKVFTSFVLAASLVGIAAFATNLWLQSPIKLSFAPLTVADGTQTNTPLRARYDVNRQQFVYQRTCIGKRRLPVYKAGDWMLVRATINRPGWLTSKLGGYRFLIVSVSEKTGVKVFPPATLRKGTDKFPAREGKSGFTVALPVSGPVEGNKLIILAKRLGSFDAKSLQEKLNRSIETIPAKRYINIIVSTLSGQPGYQDYSFLSIAGEPECTN